MSKIAFSSPVQDSVPKVGNVAIGEDLGFQAKWWKFENIVWIIFIGIIILDLLGAFGKGYMAHAERNASDNTIEVNYERIERTSTPSLLTVNFRPSAVRNGKVGLFVSDNVIRPLGNARIIPAPESSTIGNGGITYLFPATSEPMSVEFALEPTGPGIYPFTFQVPGADAITDKIIVLP